MTLTFVFIAANPGDARPAPPPFGSGTGARASQQSEGGDMLAPTLRFVTR